MVSRMSICFRRCLLVACATMTLAGCGNRETKEALQRVTILTNLKQYEDANDVLVQALRAREAQIKGPDAPVDSDAAEALGKKVQADSEILKMERAQIPLYLRMNKPDQASSVYADILAGNPGDTVAYDELKDGDPLIRTGAAIVLGASRRPESIGALINTLKDSDKNVRRAAVAALGQIKDPTTVPPLIDELKDSFWFARSEAADALGREGDVRAIAPLLDLVADPDENAESSAESSLVLLCRVPKAPADPFANRLNDPNPKIVRISAICLAVLKDPRAIPTLLKYIASNDLPTRLNAVKALGETGDASVIPTLRQTLKDPNVDMRGWSVIGLDKLKDQGSVADLRAIAANDQEAPSVRAAAQGAISHITGEPMPAAANNP
jgi:HEAT repeat protein